MLATFFKNNLPSILTGCAVAGVAETVYLAVKATPKAIRIVNELKEPSKRDIFCNTWRCYIPAAIAGFGTIACIVGANYIHLSKEVGIAAAYSLVGTKFNEYKQHAGEETDAKIKESIRKEHISNLEKPQEPLEPGKMWCYEPESDQFFQATTEQILWAELTANKIFANQGELRFNQFLNLLPGVKKVPWGDHFGWYITDDDGTWDFNWSFYRGTPWIDIQPQIAVDQDMMILSYGMHPGDETDPHDLEEPEQFEVKS